jgi:hypothetical protein
MDVLPLPLPIFSVICSEAGLGVGISNVHPGDFDEVGQASFENQDRK